MIIDILDFIKDNLINGRSADKDGKLSVLHLDMHHSNMQRAMAFIIEGNGKYPKYVVKYPKCHAYANTLLDEFNRYYEIYGHLSPDLKKYIHVPICIYKDGDIFATIEEGLPGVSLLSLMKRKFNSNVILKAIDSSFNFLIKFQAETASSSYPDVAIIDKNLKFPFRLFQSTFSLSRKEKESLSLVEDSVTEFLMNTKSVSACHGDFWPNNILIHGKKIFVIDWTNCINKFFRFWDFYSLIYMTSVRGSRKKKDQYDKIYKFYLNKIGITPEVDLELRVTYCAIRSVWGQFLFNEVSIWDNQWKDKFNVELSRYLEK